VIVNKQQFLVDQKRFVKFLFVSVIFLNRISLLNEKEKNNNKLNKRVNGDGNLMMKSLFKSLFFIFV